MSRPFMRGRQPSRDRGVGTTPSSDEVCSISAALRTSPPQLVPLSKPGDSAEAIAKLEPPQVSLGFAAQQTPGIAVPHRCSSTHLRQLFPTAPAVIGECWRIAVLFRRCLPADEVTWSWSWFWPPNYILTLEMVSPRGSRAAGMSLDCKAVLNWCRSAMRKSGGCNRVGWK